MSHGDGPNGGYIHGAAGLRQDPASIFFVITFDDCVIECGDYVIKSDDKMNPTQVVFKLSLRGERVVLRDGFGVR